MKDLTKGNVAKTLFFYSLPFLAGMVLQSAINFTDLLLLSRYSGDNAVIVGVGIGSQLCYMIVNFVIGLCSGGSIAVSRAFGAGDDRKIAGTVKTLAVVLGIIAVILTPVVIFGAKPLLSVMKTPPTAIIEANRYVLFSMLGLPCVLGLNGVSAVLRGLGDTKVPLMLSGIAFILNVGLDFLVTVGLKRGAGAVALTTSISIGVAFIVGAIYLVKKLKQREINFMRARIDKPSITTILKLGIPVSVQNAVASLSFLLLNYVIGVANGADATVALAAASMVFKINSFAILPSRSYSATVAAMVGQNLGANKQDRAKQTFSRGVFIGVAIGVCFSAISFFGARLLLNIFTMDNQTLSFGIPYMKILAIDYTLQPIATAMFGYVDGEGKTVVSMWVNVITALLFRLPFAYAFGVLLSFALRGVAFAIPLSTLLSIVIMLVYLVKKGDLKKPQKKEPTA